MQQLAFLFAAAFGVPIAAVCVSARSAATQISRRSFLAGAVLATSANQSPAAAAETVKVYFGAGCFWHVQHELYGEEISTLQRSPIQVTAVTGYAGGLGQTTGAKVCYHNKDKIADYGVLGHAEAVQVDIPVSSFPSFCKRYFALFGNEGLRHDPKDRGSEYRSLLGLPEGQASPLYAAVKQAAAESLGGMKLARGNGNDPDTFNEKLVYIYDSDAFPFYRAELYHQFHNDYLGNVRPGEPVTYGKAYNSLQQSLSKLGVLVDTGCPAPPRYML